MGVKACSKKGCENIMCDFCGYDIGYVCNECIEDFKSKVCGYNLRDFGDVEEELKLFLENRKSKKYSNSQSLLNDYFKIN